MGGSALLIYGTPSAELLTPRAAARSLADRLLGRHPMSGPTETPFGRDRVFLEIPSGPLRPLAADFRTFVERAFDDPWPSTTPVPLPVLRARAGFVAVRTIVDRDARS